MEAVKRRNSKTVWEIWGQEAACSTFIPVFFIDGISKHPTDSDPITDEGAPNYIGIVVDALRLCDSLGQDFRV